jgi:hypothetical protein
MNNKYRIILLIFIQLTTTVAGQEKNSKVFSKLKPSIILGDIGVNYWHEHRFIQPLQGNSKDVSITHDGYTLHSKYGFQTGIFLNFKINDPVSVRLGGVFFMENSYYETDIETQISIGRFYPGKILKYQYNEIWLDLPIMLEYQWKTLKLISGVKVPVTSKVYEWWTDHYHRSGGGFTGRWNRQFYLFIPTLRVEYQLLKMFNIRYYLGADLRYFFPKREFFYQTGILFPIKVLK